MTSQRSHSLITMFLKLGLQPPNSQPQVFPVHQEEKSAKNKKKKKVQILWLNVMSNTFFLNDGQEGQCPLRAH